MISVHTDSRSSAIDVSRGALLAAMLAVHLVSAHGSVAQDAAMHRALDVFSVSGGFVFLSGFLVGLRGGPPRGADLSRAFDACLQLLLVMVSYSVLLAVLRVWLRLGDECGASFAPPTRFEDLGILLPIALVQLLALVVRWPVAGPVVGGALALLLVALPDLTASVGSSGGAGAALLGALTRGTITPYYTISRFLAIGLAGALIGRRMATRGIPASASPYLRALALLGCAAMAVPVVGRTLLEPAYRLGGIWLGSAMTLAYWSVPPLLLVAAAGEARSATGVALAWLGRSSLLVFVLHDVLLELDLVAREGLHVARGLPAVAAMLLANGAVLIAASLAVDRLPRVRAVARELLLDRSRGTGGTRVGAFSPSGALALVVIVVVYGQAHAASARPLVVDDFEKTGRCAAWWSYGPLQFVRAPTGAEAPEQGRAVLSVRGQSGAPWASGRGIQLVDDLDDRSRIALDIRGYGPDSGRLRVELYEDDNDNWEIEKDAAYRPLHDDRLIHEISVDWWGWRSVELPLNRFVDDNPGVGNDVFDPQRTLGSGGLLQLQLQFAAAGTPPAHPAMQMDLDNLRWLP